MIKKKSLQQCSWEYSNTEQGLLEKEEISWNQNILTDKSKFVLELYEKNKGESTQEIP